ncbi:NAD(P)-binding protein [Streptomyces sp. HUAS MG91]|uniref:NAD(P)-binding protein n=1 Tax=Streptomyces tabacisoli TaxID=3156398 RepID=A0AAU8IKP2_9ACTN
MLTRTDAVIVGGGHNALVAAAYLARAGRTVTVLERLGATGGAAVSTRPFTGVDARLSRYSYLVSLLPKKIVRDLDLDFAVRPRTVSSYTPTVRDGRATGLLVGGGADRTRASFARLTGTDRAYEAWNRFYATTRHAAERIFPTLTEPLPTRKELRTRVADAAAWRLLFDEPIGVGIEEHFSDDLVRGVVLTDALIGTFADAHDPGLAQNRCFLMLLERLPRLKDTSVDPREAFAGTFHVAEGYGQLATAHAEAAAGSLPSAPPSEIYCHSLTDPTILGPDLAARGYQTLTLFGLHTPARLFTEDNDTARAALLKATLAQLDHHLAEPLEDCLAEDAEGRPCIEAKTPLDLERELRLPGGNIFHRELSFPYAQEGTGRWGVETAHANVLLCGAGAVRGGGVSGVPGHNAAMAVLGR